MTRFYGLLVFILAFSVQSNSQAVLKEGVVNLVSPLDHDAARRYIWFQDSVVIYEVYVDYNSWVNDSLVSNGSRLYKYSILDLTTMRGQDYFNFSDTAHPVTNFTLKDSEGISWKFYARTHNYDKFLDSLVQAADTTIGKVRFKRFYFDIEFPEVYQRMTYYIDCSAPASIFHMWRGMDHKFPGCRVTRVQYADLFSGNSTITELVVIRDSLTAVELSVMSKWRHNLRYSTIPVVSYREAQKIFSSKHMERFPQAP